MILAFTGTPSFVQQSVLIRAAALYPAATHHRYLHVRFSKTHRQ